MQKSDIVAKFSALSKTEQESLNAEFLKAGNKGFVGKVKGGETELTNKAIAFLNDLWKDLTSESPKAEEVKQSAPVSEVKDTIKTEVKPANETKDQTRHRVISTFLSNYLAKKESTHPIALNGKRVILAAFPEDLKRKNSVRATIQIAENKNGKKAYFDNYEKLISRLTEICTVLKIPVPEIPKEIEENTRGIFTQLAIVNAEFKEAFVKAHPELKSVKKAPAIKSTEPEILEEM